MIISIEDNVILSGTLAKDAEAKSFNKNDRTFTIYNFSVAVDKIRQDNGGKLLFLESCCCKT